MTQQSHEWPQQVDSVNRQEDTQIMDEEIAIANIAKLSHSNLVDKATLQKLAGFAQHPSPRVMAQLLTTLSGKFNSKGVNDKWVFAAVGFALWTSTFSRVQHFVDGHISLPVNLLGQLADAADKLHRGKRPDWDSLYLSLVAINACINVLLTAGIGHIDNEHYDKTARVLEAIKSIACIPPSVIFLLEQTQTQLICLSLNSPNDSQKSSIKNEMGKAFLNIGLSALYLGTGLGELIVATGVSTAFPPAAPAAEAVAIVSFGLLAGLAAERAFQGIKNIKAIKQKVDERGYVDNLWLALNIKDNKRHESPLNVLFDGHFQRIIAMLENSQTNSLQLKQLLFGLFHVLKQDRLEETKVQAVFEVIKAYYKAHQGDDKASVGLFLLEQVQQLRIHYQTNHAGDEPLCFTHFVIELANFIPNDKLSTVGSYLNSQPQNNCYYDIDFTVGRPSVQGKRADINYPVKQDSGFISSSLMTVGLSSQRAVNKIWLHQNDEQATACCVIPATPDGDCGFMAISRYLDVMGKLKHIEDKPLTRARFINDVKKIYENSKRTADEKALIDAIIKEDGADSLDDWCLKFTPSTIYMGKPHLELLSYLYGLRFEVFCLDNDTHQFIPEPLSEKIQADSSASSAQEPTTVYLAHIVAGERTEANHPNHFEGIAVGELTKEQSNKISRWRSEAANEGKKTHTVEKNTTQERRTLKKNKREAPPMTITGTSEVLRNKNIIGTRFNFSFLNNAEEVVTLHRGVTETNREDDKQRKKDKNPKQTRLLNKTDTEVVHGDKSIIDTDFTNVTDPINGPLPDFSDARRQKSTDSTHLIAIASYKPLQDRQWHYEITLDYEAVSWMSNTEINILSKKFFNEKFYSTQRSKQPEDIGYYDAKETQVDRLVFRFKHDKTIKTAVDEINALAAKLRQQVEANTSPKSTALMKH